MSENKKTLTQEEAEKLTGPNVVIPDGYTNIGDSAFKKREDIVSVVIPDGVTSIDGGKYGGTFAFCINLTDVTIPESVGYIGTEAFWGCEKLENIKIPNGVTEIGDNAFADCKSLKTLIIPSGVMYIGEYAFSDCENLVGISVPDGVTEIEEGTFQHCINMKEIRIPDSVTEIGDRAFIDCPAGQKWVEQAAAQGNKAARVYLGLEEDDDDEDEEDEDSGESGAADFINRTFQHFEEEGIDLTTDKECANEFYKNEEYEEAARFYAIAAKEGDAYSQYCLGFMYRRGQGVEKNIDLAISWLSMAIKNGSDAAAKEFESLKEEVYKQKAEYDARTTVCAWCGVEIVIDLKGKALETGDLVKCDCGKRSRYVDKTNSLKFGMEKCVPKSGVDPDWACPSCGDKLDKAISSLKPGDFVDCAICGEKYDPWEDHHTVYGTFYYLGNGDFATCKPAHCSHCGHGHCSPSPWAMGKETSETECAECGKEFTYK